MLAALALMPLAWLIGEATEHVAEHTGPGIGGFFNASFGNAPELIIALLAVYNGLPDVVRGSIIGSVVSNLLLVLGLTMFFGVAGEVDRRSLLPPARDRRRRRRSRSSSPSVPGWDGDPDRHSLYLVTLPVAVVLLALYIGITIYNLRRHRAEHVTAEPAARRWSMRQGARRARRSRPSRPRSSPRSLVGSLEEFGDTVGLSEFFVAIVIVAIVGNAAEHGGAIVVARRGKIKLATEIAVSSAAQVAVFVAPAAALLSALVGTGLPLTFRPVELVTMARRDARRRRCSCSTAARSAGRASRSSASTSLAVAAYWIAGDR